MARTTSEAVTAIIEVDASIDLDPFIEVANELVTELCTDSDYSVARLELIERWLSAHFYAIRDQRVEQEGAGGVESRFQTKLGLHLNVTVYGQQVLLIDTKGSLSALNSRASGKRGNTGITWLGTEAT